MVTTASEVLPIPDVETLDSNGIQPVLCSRTPFKEKLMKGFCSKQGSFHIANVSCHSVNQSTGTRGLVLVPAAGAKWVETTQRLPRDKITLSH